MANQSDNPFILVLPQPARPIGWAADALNAPRKEDERMIERDYIMRMISLLVQALTRVLLQKQVYDFPGARLEIDGAYKSMLGMTRAFIRQFSDLQLIEMLGKDEETVPVKCYVLGSLMHEEADIEQLEGKEAESRLLFVRSLGLLLTAFVKAGDEIEPGHRGKIDELCLRLRGDVFPVHTMEALFAYNELLGRYDKAEDVLFELFQSDTGYKKPVVSFYRRLLTRSDEELRRGGLPREEVLEALDKLSDEGSIS